MPKAQLNIRIDASVLKTLKERAAKENRTVSNLVETLLIEAVLSSPFCEGLKPEPVHLL